MYGKKRFSGEGCGPLDYCGSSVRSDKLQTYKKQNAKLHFSTFSYLCVPGRTELQEKLGFLCKESSVPFFLSDFLKIYGSIFFHSQKYYPNIMLKTLFPFHKLSLFSSFSM